MSSTASVNSARRRSRIRLAAAIAASAATVGLLGWWSGAIQPLPSILATLPGAWTIADYEFNARVSDWFPVGSSEETLIHTLAAQGFRPEWHQRDDDSRAGYVHHGLICTRSATVIWRADAGGILRKAEGHYQVDCL